MTHFRYIRFVVLVQVFLMWCAVSAFGHYRPGTGRWLERDPATYADTMQLYEYVRASPVILTDASGLDPCQGACYATCPIVGFETVLGTTMVLPVRDKQCTAICDLLCRRRGGSCQTCKPKGTVTFAPGASRPGMSDHNVVIQVSGEDTECCSAFAVLQFARVRHRDFLIGGGWSDWFFDAGQTGRSEDSPAPPYYDTPVPIRQNPQLPNAGGSGKVFFSDAPTSFWTNEWEFIILVVCTEGENAGYVYGTYKWKVTTHGTWPATGQTDVDPVGEQGSSADWPPFFRPQ